MPVHRPRVQHHTEAEVERPVAFGRVVQVLRRVGVHHLGCRTVVGCQPEVVNPNLGVVGFGV